MLQQNSAFRKLDTNFRQIFIDSMSDVVLENQPKLSDEDLWSQVKEYMPSPQKMNEMVQVMHLADLSCASRTGLK